MRVKRTLIQIETGSGKSGPDLGFTENTRAEPNRTEPPPHRQNKMDPSYRSGRSSCRRAAPGNLHPCSETRKQAAAGPNRAPLLHLSPNQRYRTGSRGGFGSWRQRGKQRLIPGWCQLRKRRQKASWLMMKRRTGPSNRAGPSCSRAATRAPQTHSNKHKQINKQTNQSINKMIPD